MTLNELRELRLDGKVWGDDWGALPIHLNLCARPLPDSIRVVDAQDFDYRPLIDLDVYVHFDERIRQAAECAMRADNVARSVFLFHEPTRRQFFLSRWAVPSSNLKSRMTEWLKSLTTTASICATT